MTNRRMVDPLIGDLVMIIRSLSAPPAERSSSFAPGKKRAGAATGPEGQGPEGGAHPSLAYTLQLSILSFEFLKLRAEPRA